MKKIKSALICCFMAFSAVFFVACGADAKPTSVMVEGGQTQFMVGEDFSLQHAVVRISFTDGSFKNVIGNEFSHDQANLKFTYQDWVVDYSEYDKDVSGSYLIYVTYEGELDLDISYHYPVQVIRVQNEWVMHPEFPHLISYGQSFDVVAEALYGDVVVEFKPEGSDNSAYTTTKPTEVGEYRVRIYVSQSDNYQGLLMSDILFTIDPAHNSWETNFFELQAALPYTGSPIAIPAAAAFGEPVVKYKLRGANNNTYSLTAPTEVGEYTAWIYVNGTANYYGVETWFDFSIETSTNSWVTTPSLPKTSFEFGEDFGITGAAEFGQISYKHRAAGSDGEYTSGLPVNVGSYEVVAFVDSSSHENFTALSQDLGTLTISKSENAWVKDFAAGSDSENWQNHSYSGKSLISLVEAKHGDVILEYKKDGEADTAYRLAPYFDVGKYIVRYHVEETDNYTGLATKYVYVNIQMAEDNAWVQNFEISNFVYGSDPKFYITGEAKYGELTFEYKDATALEADPWLTGLPSNVGDYDVRACVPQTSNYNGVDYQYQELSITKPAANYLNDVWTELDTQITYTDDAFLDAYDISAFYIAANDKVVVYYQPIVGGEPQGEFELMAEDFVLYPGMYNLKAVLTETDNYPGVTDYKTITVVAGVNAFTTALEVNEEVNFGGQIIKTAPVSKFGNAFVEYRLIINKSQGEYGAWDICTNETVYNVGIYQFRARCIGGQNDAYEPLTGPSFEVEVNAVTLIPFEATITTFTYSGSAKSMEGKIIDDRNSALLQTYYEIDHTLSTMSATDVGSYKVVFKVKDKYFNAEAGIKNVLWWGTGSQTYTINWQIKIADNSLVTPPNLPEDNRYYYADDVIPNTLTAETQFGDAKIYYGYNSLSSFNGVFDVSDGWFSIEGFDITKTKYSTFYLVVYTEGTANYKKYLKEWHFVYNKTQIENHIIAPLQILGVDAANDNAVAYGTAYEPAIASTFGTFTLKYKKASEAVTAYTETKPTGVGEYVVQATYKGESRLYDEPIEGILFTYEFKIIKAEVAVPTLSSTEFVFNDDDQSPICSTSDLYTVAGDLTGFNATTYTITFTLKDAQNYVWADGNENAARDIAWTIAPMQITKPVIVDQQLFYYDGTEKSPVVPEAGEYFYYDGVLTATDAKDASYSFYVRLGKVDGGTTYNKNFVWAPDEVGGETSSLPVDIYWMIKYRVELPTFVTDTFVYDGTEKTPVLVETEYSERIIVKTSATDNTTSATEVGTYTITYTLNSTRHRFENGLKEIVVTWKIVEAQAL